MSASHPVIFISYAHEGDMQQRVRALADWLTGCGVKVITDHPYTRKPPVPGWRAWMWHSISVRV